MKWLYKMKSSPYFWDVILLLIVAFADVRLGLKLLLLMAVVFHVIHEMVIQYAIKNRNKSKAI